MFYATEGTSSNILDVRSKRGADINSDHHLVAASVSCRIALKRPPSANPQKKFNIEALKDPVTARNFETCISEKLETIPTHLDIESHWKLCADVITSVATECIGHSEKRVKFGWRDDEYDRAIAEKEKAYQKYIQRNTRSNCEEYRNKRREASKLYRQKKRRYEKEEIQKLEVLRESNQTRKFYQGVTKRRSGYTPSTAFCNDKSGKLITEKQGVLSRWQEFFSELLNGDHSRMTPQEETLVFNSNEDVPQPTTEEVRSAIQRLKNNKSAGSDGIPAELLKAAGTNFIDAFHQLLVKIWNAETMPNEWNQSIICPIHKKGDKKECKNYRGISLLNIAYKILASILCERLKPHVIKIVGSYQCGFMPDRSTTDQIFTLRQILEKTHEFQVDTHHLFIDFRQAYDTPQRNELFKAMNLFGIPSKLIKLCQMTLNDTWSSVKAAGTTTENFRTIRGFRQGDALSCSFFNILLELIMVSANINTGNIIFNKSNQVLAYADDIDLIGRSSVNVVESFLRLERAAESVGLQVNGDKTKYMLSTPKHTAIEPIITMGSYNIEVVKNFVYLGSEVTSNNDVSAEINRRIILASRCLGGLRKLLRSNHLSRKTKIKLYRQLIQPVLLYGFEAWTMKASDEKFLLVFERKILRIIFGPICENGEWRIRYNQELKQLYRNPDVVQKIKLNV